MAEQMIRKDGVDKNGQKSLVGDIVEKQVALDKGKKPDKGKGKASVTRRSQSKGSESPIVPCVDRERDHSEIEFDRPGPSGISNKNENTQILAMLKSIQDNQNIQGQELQKLSTRMTEYENDYDEEYEDAQDHDNDDYEETHDNNEDQNQVDAPPNKRKADDNSTSKFASMTKRIKTRETLGAKIDETLADNVTDLFRNGMNEDQFVELTKDENNPRPENCEGLANVKTNQLIWDFISPQAQSVDRKMQIIQKAIVKASTVLVNTVNKMATADENNNAIDECNDAIAILGHANRKVNITRRELMKPEMCSEYLHLCSQSVEYTSYLFGDDVQKKAKEIEDCSKISNKIQSGNGGYGYNNNYYTRRGRSRSFGRGRGGRRSRGGRGGRGSKRGSGNHAGNHAGSNQSEPPKNLLKRGGFQNKDRT